MIYDAISGSAISAIFGIGGSTVRPGLKSMQNTRNMNVISSYNPDVIFLGGNDIKIATLIQWNWPEISSCLQNSSLNVIILHVIIGQLFRRYSRRNPINYNELVYDVNKQLTEQTGDESKISLWHHRRFCFNTRQYISADGVHFNNLGMRKFAHRVWDQPSRSLVGVAYFDWLAFTNIK